jgi:ABC-2 type transport system permease protein/lipopolysaccharide transport system permease protein
MNTIKNRFIGELYGSRNVLSQLVTQQLILRYRRTTLGYLWTLINPLVMMSIMAWVFSTIFNAEIKSFTVFLFAGMIPWTFFSNVTVQSGVSFINNESLIKKIYIPKIIFPLSISIAILIDSLLSFLALFIIILALGGIPSISLMFLPAAFVLLFFFTLGVALVISIATVFYRDLQHIILIAMQGIFFLTPVLYKQSQIKGPVELLVAVNPVAPFIEMFRAPLTQAILPDSGIIVQCMSLSSGSFIIGLVVFIYCEKSIVFRL